MENLESPLAIKAREFLEARKYSSNLEDILASINDDENTVLEVISVLQVIFMEILKRRTMMKKEQDHEDSAISDYISWLRDSYDKVWKILIGLMSNQSVCEHASSTLFTLLGQEGKFPIRVPKKGQYYFPNDKFQILLKMCLSMQSNLTAVQNQIDEYTNFIDVVYYFWVLTPKILQKLINPREKQIIRILSILQRVPVPSEDELIDVEEDVLFCFTKSKAKFKPKYNVLQESVDKLWNLIIRWNRSNNTHKKILILLIESIMPHLPKPVLTMDYLMESLNAGGSISLLALQGIFTLVKDHNLEYPNIYGKLYSFFHASIFYTKYKSRLYMLANIFLSSTHIPETMIASFIKRFARLCLQAPPQDIIILSSFIGNLMIRHPSLKILIQHPTEKAVSVDPFLEKEPDPLKTNALESSLWELETLQQHVLPSVSKAVSFINKPLPNTEWDLTSLIETTYEQIFEKESRKKLQNVTVTFEKPDSLILPNTNYFSDIWCFDR